MAEGPETRIIGLETIEIDRQHSSDDLISLKVNSMLLSPTASMLCLILASCECESVPAFLFVRPYLPQRRWNLDGEIEVHHARGLPEWPKQIFRRQRQESVAGENRAAAGNADADFYASAIGHRLDTNDAEFYNFSQDTASLCRQHILSAHLDEDDVWLQLNVCAKAQIWRQTSVDDRLLLWYCLLKLVVFSYPDIYSSTVSPFLAVIGWEQLRSCKIFIPHLMSFLLNYSVSKGSYLKLQSVLEPGLLQDLMNNCDQTVQDTISIMNFQEHFYYTIFLQPRTNESLFIEDQYVVPKFSGFIAITVALVLDMVPEVLHSHMVSVISDIRQLMYGEKRSTIENFAFMILYLYNLDIKDLNLDNIEARVDLESKMALGLEMARYQRAPDAYTILGSCIKDMDAAGCVGSREFCMITTELVKCCNMMGEEAKAESLARQVLGFKRNPQTQYQHALCYLNLALADTLMGQGEYESAETLMLDVLAVKSLPRRTQTMIRLRLNKARRRLRRNELTTSVKASFIQPILESIGDLDRDLKIEILAELSATVSLAPKQNDEPFERLRELIYDTVVAIAASPDIVVDWRIPALEQDLNRANFHSLKHNVEKEVLQVLQPIVVDWRIPAWVFQPGLEVRFGHNQPDLEAVNDLEARNDLEAVIDPLPRTQQGRAYSNLFTRLFSWRSWRERPKKEDAEVEREPPGSRPSLGPLDPLDPATCNIAQEPHPREEWLYELDELPDVSRYFPPFSGSSSSPDPGPSVQMEPKRAINEQRTLLRATLPHVEATASATNQLTPNYERPDPRAFDPSNVLSPPERLPQHALEGD